MAALRPDWDTYFLDLAKSVATRATCLRKQVGCVIVRDRRVLTTGYNGSAPGDAHCLDVGCEMVNGHCARTIHAEANAIAQAARHGVGLVGATAYVTLQPCSACNKILRSAGVTHWQFAEQYK